MIAPIIQHFFYLFGLIIESNPKNIINKHLFLFVNI